MGPTYGVTNNGMTARTSASMNTQNPFAVNMRYGLNGRYIKDPKEIQAGEVPMDGSVSFFPMADNSYIVGKMWGQDGIIREVRYIPENVLEAKIQELQNSQSNTISTVLNEILDKISKIENSLNS